MTVKLSDSELNLATEIVALFSVLIHSWLINDFHEAAHARGELHQLGFEIQISRHLPTRLGKGNQG